MEPQNFTLLLTDDRGCVSDVSDVLINVVGEDLGAFPQASPKEICLGVSTILQANATGGGGNYTYNWTSSEAGWSAAGDSIKVSPEQTTTYFLEVTDGYTTYNSHVVVPVLPLPKIDLLPSGYIELGKDTIVACVRDTITLDAGDDSNPVGTEYLWSNNWAGQYMIAKTNGNWFDIQTYAVQVRNPVTNCSSNDQVTVLFDFNACAIGIREMTRTEMPVTVHPNPGKGLFYLQSSEQIERLETKVFTIEGISIIEKTFEDIPENGWKAAIDISGFDNGIYMLWLSVDGSAFVVKLIKQ
jgi:hypothetical protein